ncbi:hypothetical protein [Orrella dioscoreae]|uniref:hypothetical protein n=1 Tax=Orrella dioscoreae TaxID=1851544 RepID=UPI00082A19B7|nr:hypothetical protein [Orrella dioscoreae]
MRTNALLLWFAFPGYAIYHVLRPHFLPNTGIGLFTITLLIAAAASVSSWLYRGIAGKPVLNTAALPVAGLHWALMIWMACIILINTGAGNVAPVDAVASLQFVVAMAGMFCLGVGFTKPRGGVLFVTWSGFFLWACIYYYVPSLGYIEIPPGSVEDQHTAYALTANYQGIARSIMYTGLLFVPFIKSRLVKSAVFIFYCGLLVMSGSRTDAALMVLLVPVFAYINYGPVKTVMLGAAAVAGLTLLALAYGLEGGGRYSMGGASASLGERSLFLSSGLENILANPVQGDFMYYLREFGSSGAYIHNGLSMWADYGLFAMALYVALIFSALAVGMAEVFSGRRTGIAECLLYLSITSLIGVAISRSISWPMPALAWGIAYGILSRKTQMGRQGAAVQLSTPSQ